MTTSKVSTNGTGSMTEKVSDHMQPGYSPLPSWLVKAAPRMGFKTPEAAKQYLFHPETGAFERLGIAAEEMVADYRMDLLDRRLAKIDALRSGIVSQATNTGEFRAVLLDCIQIDSQENPTTAQHLAGALPWSEARKPLIRQINASLKALLMGDRLAADRQATQ